MKRQAPGKKPQSRKKQRESRTSNSHTPTTQRKNLDTLHTVRVAYVKFVKQDKQGNIYQPFVDRYIAAINDGVTARNDDLFPLAANILDRLGVKKPTPNKDEGPDLDDSANSSSDDSEDPDSDFAYNSSHAMPPVKSRKTFVKSKKTPVESKTTPVKPTKTRRITADEVYQLFNDQVVTPRISLSATNGECANACATCRKGAVYDISFRQLVEMLAWQFMSFYVADLEPWDSSRDIPSSVLTTLTSLGCIFVKPLLDHSNHKDSCTFCLWCTEHKKVEKITLRYGVIMAIGTTRDLDVVRLHLTTQDDWTHLCHHPYCAQPAHGVRESPRDNRTRNTCRPPRRCQDKAAFINSRRAKCTHTPTCYPPGTSYLTSTEAIVKSNIAIIKERMSHGCMCAAHALEFPVHVLLKATSTKAKYYNRKVKTKVWDAKSTSHYVEVSPHASSFQEAYRVVQGWFAAIYEHYVQEHFMNAPCGGANATGQWWDSFSAWEASEVFVAGPLRTAIFTGNHSTRNKASPEQCLGWVSYWV
ncbi:hypothetical protein P153DRAFT_364253 [Dothidotthia symphoricarpi CBS 119687]|uniref:Zinc-binding loop region of homing endonuclease domain-containing protein n=1 Tax=Dothidotthia symphoricarpi CBS 119687 TaxID=1392245 RepID=A0A6A6AM16_9PLEO|nr:uncharacterized protein P153DRAFT_364253 [Dothidotthia symphoricarpi CBS 119687]KAF2133022.1 hypothetical protein P153DRAFT_364253 [Dothidotthia symphoricarpi CBS 119687]